MRRGRRDRKEFKAGNTLDCWRVEAMEPGRILRLAVEMRVPGRAWLEFEITGDGKKSVIRQTVIF